MQTGLLQRFLVPSHPLVAGFSLSLAGILNKQIEA